MDPKDNTEPNDATGAQTNPDAATTDATQPAGTNDAPSLSPDNPTDTSAVGGQGQGATQGVEVDLSALSDTPSTSGTGDSANPATSDAATPDAASSPVAFGGSDPTQSSISDTSGVPPADSAIPGAPGATPPATPDFGATPGPNTDQSIGGAAPVPSVPPAGVDAAGVPGPDVSAPTPGPDQPAGAGIPPTTPVPAHHGDKKTIIVLAGVAVILIVAIVVLFLL